MKLNLLKEGLKFFIFAGTVFLLSFGQILGIPEIGTHIFVPSLFIISLFINSKKKVSKEIILYFFLIISAVISTSFSISLDHSLEITQKMVGVFILGYAISILNSKFKIFYWIIIAYVLSTIILISYEIYTGTFILNHFAENRNRDLFLLNANFYSYLISFSTVGLYFLYERKKTTINLFLILIIQSLFLATTFYTASRGGLLSLAIVNIGYWFFINQNKSFFIKGIKISILISVMVFAYQKVYLNSFMSERNNTQSGIYDNSREQLLNDGISTLQEYPVFGVGPGNFIFYSRTGDYSHISFVEVIVTQGIIGLLILMGIFFIPLKKWYILREKHQTTSKQKLYLLFLVTFYIYNFFYPFYLYLDLMMFFFLIISELNIELKKKQ